MANLSITTVCDRTCGYCFARAAFDRLPVAACHMSPDVFERALGLLERSGIDQARFLGGEPTLHPDFARLVDRALGRGLRVLIFSHGSMPEPVLTYLEGSPRDRVAVLVNVADPAGRRPEAQEQQTAAFHRLGPRISLGLNIDRPGVQMGFLLDLIEQFGLARCIRLGLAHPCLNGTNRFLHPRHYPEVGRRVAAFAARARQAGVALEFDCGFVPCMFPPDFVETMGESGADIGRRCNPVLDILPDGQVVSCYPLAAMGHHALPEDHGASWLREFFAAKAMPLRSSGLFRECARCLLRQRDACTGGCLSAAAQRLRRAPFTFSLENAPTAGLPAAPAVAAEPCECRERSASREARGQWVIPYVDQPMAFWGQLRDDFGEFVRGVYCPLPGNVIGSGRPVQPDLYLDQFLRSALFSCSVLINPIALPQPVEEVAPQIVEVLRRLTGEVGIVGATVSNLPLAARIREDVPELALTASVLMDIATPLQAIMVRGICDTLVPASRIVRDLPALQALRAAFAGRIRIMVNEACLPGCLYRVQHFLEMANSRGHPESLCQELLERHPWLRLTGAWVLPQHLHLYEGVYDELKLAGRVILRNPGVYRHVLRAYVNRESLGPNAIGGGPASVLEPFDITEQFFEHTLHCGHRCVECDYCIRYDRLVRSVSPARPRSALATGHLLSSERAYR